MGAPQLKDFVDRDLVVRLAERYAAVHAGFDQEAFVEEVAPALGSLELKERIARVARGLGGQLPEHFPEAASVLVAGARHGEPPDGWEAWPLSAFIEIYGTDHPVEALDAMEVITTYSSCEFALRPQLEHNLEITLARLHTWADHDHESVRRLVSEGSRPRLPWGKGVPALREDPGLTVPLLERLKDDPSETVRRSVANHLNDISKDHAETAVEVAGRWRGGSDTPEMRALLSHGLRTLVKRGDRGALEVLGFTTDAEVEVVQFECEPSMISIGGAVELTAHLRSTGRREQRVVVDLVVHFVKASGATSPKVFKWRTLDLGPEEEVRLNRRQSFRDLSTRTHRPGMHRFVLQVAGEAAAETACEVVA